MASHPTLTHYDVLDIPKDATNKEIRTAYHKAAFKWHPDKNPDDVAGTTAKFKEISEAYTVLGDLGTRACYDGNLNHPSIFTNDHVVFPEQHAYESKRASAHSDPRADREAFDAFCRRHAEEIQEQLRKEEEERRKANENAHEAFVEQEQKRQSKKRASQENKRDKTQQKEKDKIKKQEKKLYEEQLRKQERSLERCLQQKRGEQLEKVDEVAAIQKDIGKVSKKVNEIEKLVKLPSAGRTKQQSQKISQGKEYKKELQQCEEKLQKIQEQLETIRQEEQQMDQKLEDTKRELEKLPQ